MNFELMGKILQKALAGIFVVSCRKDSVLNKNKDTDKYIINLEGSFHSYWFYEEELAVWQSIKGNNGKKLLHIKPDCDCSEPEDICKQLIKVVVNDMMEIFSIKQPSQKNDIIKKAVRTLVNHYNDKVDQIDYVELIKTDEKPILPPKCSCGFLTMVKLGNHYVCPRCGVVA